MFIRTSDFEIGSQDSWEKKMKFSLCFSLVTNPCITFHTVLVLNSFVTFKQILVNGSTAT